ncbi:MAG: formate dehydrogenase subunit gamma [Gammaproteobacteria bacterium]|nr:formate dehydrogenase subunit gamma [Gammaproteobacteria bacterium]
MADKSHGPDLILRHEPRDRVLHWLIVIAFVGAAASGMALFHPALYWLSNLLGGGRWSVILHPFVGIAMMLFWVPFARMAWSENRLQPYDRRWLSQIGDVVANRDDRLPDIGKYNAGQKLLYYVMVACMIVLLLSGIVIWRRYFAASFPIGVVRLAGVAHAVAAFVLVLGIVVHVSAAVWVKGSISSMMGGKVTPGWAWKHHRLWFRERIRSQGTR